MLLGFTGFYWVLLGFTGFYWFLLVATWFYLVSWSVIEFYCVLPGFTGLYRVLLGFTGFYCVLRRRVGRRGVAPRRLFWNDATDWPTSLARRHWSGRLPSPAPRAGPGALPFAYAAAGPSLFAARNKRETTTKAAHLHTALRKRRPLDAASSRSINFICFAPSA